MKDELIDTINAEISRNRYLITVSTFILAGIDVLVTLLITYYKHPELMKMTDATLGKIFAGTLAKQ